MQLDPHAETAIGHAARKIFSAHRGDPNFTGCGVGFRRRAGRLTDEPAAVAMIVNKRPEAIVSQRKLLPKTVVIDGRNWGVDVVEVGPLTLAGTPTETAAVPAVSGPIIGIYRPPIQGCGISNVNSDAENCGTFGCLVHDLSDGTVCVLSTNHVLARHNKAAINETIIQPGSPDGGTQVDGIAALKRFITLGSGSNSVDAAIAQLNDQSHVSSAVATGLMGPISPDHPAVGMAVADDSTICGRNSFLCRMDTTLAKLNVKLLGATSSSPAVVAPQAGMHIEKVGRTSGYTSTMIAATGAIIKVTSPIGDLTFSDMIWTQGLTLFGDSGAVACRGGDGRTFALLPGGCDVASCAMLSALATYYDVELDSVENNELADKLRDTFLSQSMTGQLIIGAAYLNSQVVIDRLNSRTGPDHNQAMAQAKAQQFYDQYHDLAARLINSASPTDVVTSSDLNTVASVLAGLTLPTNMGGTAMTTTSESRAAWSLYRDVLQPTVGMNRQQLIDYMNTSAVFQEVHAKMLTVATIRTSGTVS